MEESERDKALHELALQVKHGDRDVLGKLLADTNIKNVIYGIANKMVGPDNADDMYQEVCLLVHQKIRTWQGRSKITDWVSKITVNTCIDFLRKTKPHWIVMTANVPEGETEPEQTRNIFIQEKLEIIHKALQEMGETCKQLVTLHLFEGLEKKEIMEVVKLKKSSFYERWKACYNTLRRKIRKMIQK